MQTSLLSNFRVYEHEKRLRARIKSRKRIFDKKPRLKDNKTPPLKVLQPNASTIVDDFYEESAYEKNVRLAVKKEKFNR